MEQDEKKEIRNIGEPVTVTGEAESRRVEGYALLFNTKSDGLDWEETIESTAMDGVLERSNVFALLNHDPERGILARSKSGTLSLAIDARGLRYSFDAPHTQLGDELLEYLHRGEINSSSFAFTVADDVWEYKEDGTAKRTIKQIDKLYDISPVFDAVYSKTTAYARGLDELKQAKEKEEREIEQQKKAAELDRYFSELEDNLN